MQESFIIFYGFLLQINDTKNKRLALQHNNDEQHLFFSKTSLGNQLAPSSLTLRIKYKS